MDYLDRMKNPMEWEKYYTYCESSDHIGKRDLRQLREYIDERKYSVVLDNINNHVPFPYPHKYTLNKMGVGKKRIVYTYDETENYVLKMLAFLLHDKDRFSQKIYFRLDMIRESEKRFHHL